MRAFSRRRVPRLGRLRAGRPRPRIARRDEVTDQAVHVRLAVPQRLDAHDEAAHRDVAQVVAEQFVERLVDLDFVDRNDGGVPERGIAVVHADVAHEGRREPAGLQVADLRSVSEDPGDLVGDHLANKADAGEPRQDGDQQEERRGRDQGDLEDALPGHVENTLPSGPVGRWGGYRMSESKIPSLVARGSVGGFLMGLANLVPGISGGTMLLATGVYQRFIDAVAEVSTLRFRLRSVVLLGSSPSRPRSRSCCWPASSARSSTTTSGPRSPFSSG